MVESSVRIVCQSKQLFVDTIFIFRTQAKKTRLSMVLTLIRYIHTHHTQNQISYLHRVEFLQDVFSMQENLVNATVYLQI